MSVVCRRSWIAVAVIGVAVIWGGMVKADEKPKDDKPQSDISANEQTIIDLINQFRKEKDLPPLKPNALLIQAARDHSKNMAKQRKMEHVLDDKNVDKRVKETGYKSVAVGENIARWMKPKEIVNAWMHSPGHRANILDKQFQEIGIGIAADDKGIAYYAAVFGASRDSAKKGN